MGFECECGRYLQMEKDREGVFIAICPNDECLNLYTIVRTINKSKLLNLKTTSRILINRASFFSFSYETIWNRWMYEYEKGGLSYEEVINYIEERRRLSVKERWKSIFRIRK